MNVFSVTKIILYKITRTETSASTFNVFSVTKIILYKITRTDTSASTLNVFFVTQIILYRINNTRLSQFNFVVPKIKEWALHLFFYSRLERAFK